MAKAPKYAGVINTLTRHEDTEPDKIAYQHRVNGRKIEIRTACDALTGTTLGAMFAAARARKDALDVEMYAANLEIEALSQLLVDSYDNQDPAWGAYGKEDHILPMIDGSKMAVRAEPYTSVTDPAALNASVKGTDLEKKLSLPWGTVNALNNERLLAREAPLPGTKITSRFKIVYYGPPKKGTAARSDDADE